MNREATQTQPGYPGVTIQIPSYGSGVSEPQKTIEINRRPTAGGGTAIPPKPLVIVSNRPAYIPDPGTTIPTNYGRYYITWGMVNGVLGDNWDDHVDIATNVAGATYFYMKVYLEPVTSTPVPPEVIVSNWEWVTFTEAQISAGNHHTPPYSTTGDRPAHMFIPIGFVNTIGTPLATYISNSAAGSVNIIEYVMNVNFIGEGGTAYQKALNPLRLQAP